MAVIVPERLHRRGIWTEAYCLRHCEGYRVCGPAGTVGYVEEVWLSPEGDPETLLVRGRHYERLHVPVGLVEEIDTGAECLRVGELEP